ncbi:hypothetical protein [Hymenobacter cellulosilyticus]|uniref:Uncharacterized protein n=1 Tax=Hymenobacter cellulosilyticus TaxID=2932248 RepID=A0A8T9QC66_9BACT|nr:hypothetical protein [Hymenobacter cellulosilyticus]UOQ72443.1 hypothetical protein MUN79_00035 [Hymenobacter cellulosilyticus]
MLRHRSIVGKYSFGQRLGTEYGISFQQYDGSEVKDRALGRLRLDVERSFVLGEALTLSPRLAYEAAAYLRLQRDEDQAKERVVDFGNLRAEVGVRFSPELDITLWTASQTQYLNTLAQFDASGRQVGGGRTNLRTPLLGLDLRLTLNAGKRELWQPLPTQH